MSNLIFTNVIHFNKLFITIFTLLITFYYYFKSQIFKFSPVIALKTNLIKNHPLSQVIGAVELSSIAIFHVLFCFLIAFLFKINLSGAFLNTTALDCAYGILIGIGCVGTSILLCATCMKIIELHEKDNAPKSQNEWLAISGAGWMKHHKHTIKILPVPISILIITLQIGSEETIFRSILIQLFEPYGIIISLTISTLLFIYMQTFHMPNMLSAMFPVIGATVMGVTHGFLYVYHPSVTPLIISHLTFFIFMII